MRRLIINADDFGLTAGVSRAIVAAHQHGVVSSTSLMANGPAFHEAVAAAKALQSLAIGCHVVLLDGTPLLPPTQIPSLMGRSRNESTLPGGLVGFAARALAGHVNPQQIEAEAIAQMRKIHTAGITLSHFDTHKHTHMFPAVLGALLKAAKTCGVGVVRNPFPPVGEVPLAVLLSRFGLWKRFVQLKFLRSFAGNFQETVKKAGLVTPDGTIGIAITGSLDEKLFRLIVETLPEGTWEFVCHPGYDDAELASKNTRLKASRAREFEVLTSPSAREILVREGIELISFRDLAPLAHRQKT